MIKENYDDSAVIHLSDGDGFFDGHFEKIKIFPAVAQIDCSVRAYKRKNKDNYLYLKKAKFLNKVSSGVEIFIGWKKTSEDSMVFEIWCKENLCSRIEFSLMNTNSSN